MSKISASGNVNAARTRRGRRSASPPSPAAKNASEAVLAPPATTPAAESDQPAAGPAVEPATGLPAGAEQVVRGLWLVRRPDPQASASGTVWMSPARAAIEFRLSLQTAYRAQERQNISRRPLPIGDWFRLMATPIADARARKLAAEAELAELEVERQRGELVQVDVVVNVLSKLLAPIAHRLRALPAELAQHCNPADIILARDVLQRWVDDTLPLLRQDLTSIINEAREAAEK